MARTKRITSPRLCLDCSADISARGNRAVRCIPCSDMAKKVQNREYECSEKGKAYQRKRAASESRKAAKRLYNATERGKESNRAGSRRYNGSEKYKAAKRRYNASAHGKIANRQHSQIRRARKLGQLGIITPNVAAKLAAATKCALCSRKFTKANPKHIDHVIPLALGGLHEDANLQAACANCNRRKHAKDPIAFAKTNGRLL